MDLIYLLAFRWCDKFLKAILMRVVTGYSPLGIVCITIVLVCGTSPGLGTSQGSIHIKLLFYEGP